MTLLRHHYLRIEDAPAQGYEDLAGKAARSAASTSALGPSWWVRNKLGVVEGAGLGSLVEAGMTLA